MQTQTLL